MTRSRTGRFLLATLAATLLALLLARGDGVPESRPVPALAVGTESPLCDEAAPAAKSAPGHCRNAVRSGSTGVDRPGRSGARPADGARPATAADTSGPCVPAGMSGSRRLAAIQAFRC
ncbi:hypothetical protein C0216_31790 (plasmid) [Streptomyces globosus]|uniref:Secreted protein n=1 Tax=Streptomyces globosus TaxID=68209 RepID=A0A344UB10_9ACTN|nr:MULTISPECIES: hypothetical protein [Streptomyces]AXE28081.1 hypothetical protein C0216_31790 [Streptomyces globosus]